MYYNTSVSQTNAHIIEMCEEYGEQIYIISIITKN